MSRSAEIVRQSLKAFDAFMSGELSGEAYAESFDSQIEVLWHEQAYPDFPQHLRGVAAVIGFSEQYRDGWTDVTAEALEATDAPGGRIVVLVRQSGRGRESGVPNVVHFFQLVTLRAGRICKIEYFRHRADAVAAAGVRD